MVNSEDSLKGLTYITKLVTGNLNPHKTLAGEAVKSGFIFPPTCDKEYCMTHGTCSDDLGRLEKKRKRTRKKI